MRKILFVILVLGIVGASAAGTFADFSDIEVSADNMFKIGKWRDGTVKIDVHPGSCPNPINVESGGVLPVAILGTEDWPVYELDPTSVRIWRIDNGNYIGGVKPIWHSYEDTAIPFYPTLGGDCCHEYSPPFDDIDDLNVKFNKTELITDLMLYQIPHNTTTNLRVTVNDLFGNTLEGKDCVKILHGWGKCKNDK